MQYDMIESNYKDVLCHVIFMHKNNTQKTKNDVVTNIHHIHRFTKIYVGIYVKYR